MLLHAPVEGAAVGVGEVLVPLPELADAGAHGGVPGGQEHSQLPPGHGLVQAQGVVAVDDGVGALQLFQVVEVRVVRSHVGEGGELQQVLDGDHPVAGFLQELQVLAQAVGHGGAQGHVVAVLLEDDLPAEEVLVLL